MKDKMRIYYTRNELLRDWSKSSTDEGKPLPMMILRNGARDLTSLWNQEQFPEDQTNSHCYSHNQPLFRKLLLRAVGVIGSTIFIPQLSVGLEICAAVTEIENAKTPPHHMMTLAPPIHGFRKQKYQIDSSDTSIV